MATFTCEVVRADISEHPNADALEICTVGLFQSIVRKGLLKTGDLCVYIPEFAICPEAVIRACYAWDDVKGHGKLAGSNYDRVKACRIRGVLSQGLVYLLSDLPEYAEGYDLKDELGITKYDPKIPSHFFNNGQPKIAGAFHGYTPNFDVENLKKYKNAFEEDEFVTVTEKLHGTCCIIGCFSKQAVEQYGFDPENLYKGQVWCGTKNLTRRGIIYKADDMTNIYARVPMEMGILDNIIDMVNTPAPEHNVISCLCLLGEIFGSNVQDLSYDLKVPTFRAFDIWVSELAYPSSFSTIAECDLNLLLKAYEIPRVPILYSGPYNKDLHALNSGKSTLAPNQIREGIVIRSEDGQKLYKYVSEEYVLRKNATEYE